MKRPQPGSPEYEELHRECIPLRGQLRTAKAEIEDLRNDCRALRGGLRDSQRETALARREAMQWRRGVIIATIVYLSFIVFLITR